MAYYGALAPTAVASRQRVVALCAPYQYMPVRNGQGGKFIIRNDNYGGRAECLRNSGGWPNFEVSRSAADSGPEPGAFPYIFLGCSWGLCTPRSGLPARISALHRLQTTWNTSQDAAGRWDATYDIWFGRTPITTGQATGGELMIWLNSRGLPRPRRRTPVVREDRARWFLLSWITHHDGRSWRIIQFRRVRPESRVSRLHLRPFIRRAERHRWIARSSWLLNIEAGFEIWSRGAHLTTRWFAASA